MRIRRNDFAREFQCSHRLLTTDGWKLVEEDVETVSGFEIVEKRLHGDTRIDEDRRSAEDFRISMYHEF